MSQIIEYSVKLSGTLVILYLFYWLVLSRLTFYTANRWYLLGYSIFAFLIPLINVSPILEKAQLYNNEVVRWIPLMTAGDSKFTNSVADNASQWNTSGTIFLVFCTGGLLLLIRFFFKYLSVRSIRLASKLIEDGKIKIYQVDKNIIPFSFGNSIFINQHKHTELELKDIIRHEFIHVKQKHTIDIIWSECLCILNWYNPFAWLIRSAIRQNLEFIADDNVIQNGIDKKQYQYLLLKVIGVPQYSIATSFNFNSLKKRITMMNKMRSAKMHFFRFLFILPLIAVTLLSFRNRLHSSTTKLDEFTGASFPIDTPTPPTIIDSVPSSPKGLQPPSVIKTNSKGYIITIADNEGECVVIVKNVRNEIVKAVSLVEWDEKAKEYLKTYGEISPRISRPGVATDPVPQGTAAPSATPQPTPAPESIAGVHVQNKLVTITMKNGKTENYDLNNPQHKAVFEKKYGRVALSRNESPKVIIDTAIMYDKEPVRKDAPVVISQLQSSNKLETGDSSFKIAADVLLVIDGKEYTTKTREVIEKLDPNTIESIDVLKDETGRQLYGEKGKNGVINITTRVKLNQR